MTKTYIGASKGVSLVSRLIRWRQWGFPYTHIFYVGQEFPEYPNDPDVIEAWWDGVVSGELSLRHTPGTEFSLYSFEVDSREQAVSIDDFMVSLVGKKYDWRGIFGFMAFSKKVENAKRWFCSECVFAAALRVEVELLLHTAPAEVSPRLFLKSPLLKHEGDYVLPKKEGE